MQWRQGRPAGGVCGAVERGADGAVSGGPDEGVGGEIGCLEEIGKVGLGFGFAGIEIGG